MEGINLVVDGFDVVNEGVYPSEDALKNDYDCVMLTGSGAFHIHCLAKADECVRAPFVTE